MECKYCPKELMEYIPLYLCVNCTVWYREEYGDLVEENGVYNYCETREKDPDRCDPFVLGLVMKPAEVEEDESISTREITLDNMNRADQICATCENKNFVLDK